MQSPKVFFCEVSSDLSGSCSFAAFATTRSLFTKDAGLIPSLAFLLASTNIVIELGIVIAIFLGWQFVVGEYMGGLLLILLCGLQSDLLAPIAWLKQRENIHESRNSLQRITISLTGKTDYQPRRLTAGGRPLHYGMENGMESVTVGFTVAGIIAVYFPDAFFQMLFVGSGTDDLQFWQIFLQSLVGPVAAFFTFIGSMGNIPLVAVLYNNGVSFAGVMPHIF